MPYTHDLGGTRHRFADLRMVMAMASPHRSGDVLAGVAATSAEQRVAARLVLADLPLATFLADLLVPYESDEVTRLIIDSHDAAAFAAIAHLTVGGLRDWLLSDAADGAALAALAMGLTPEMVAAVTKIMRNQDLIAVARKIRVITRFRGTIGLPMEELHTAIRDVPKPVIARVNGFAIGGGNVLATLCDLTIASEKAQFGQVGPKVGSVDPGFGTAYLARIVGEKKAREIWYLCRRYTAAEAERMGLVNVVVPHDQLDAEVARWCAELLERSPTAIAIAKRSFNADSENIRGIGGMGMQALSIYYDTEESKEGVRAFNEKRKPDFRKYQK
jgi:2-ketocyclohexanecarboxyl-CoA hydrolase